MIQEESEEAVKARICITAGKILSLLFFWSEAYRVFVLTKNYNMNEDE
jgi:hypothetical protein